LSDEKSSFKISLPKLLDSVEEFALEVIRFQRKCKNQHAHRVGVHVFQVTKHLLFSNETHKKTQHPAGLYHQDPDDNQVSVDHYSFTEVMVKGRALTPRPLSYKSTTFIQHTKVLTQAI
jgi:hypothetical protein